MIRITVKLHENHVQTSVTRMHVTSGNYDCYARMGYDLPLKIFNAETFTEIMELITNKDNVINAEAYAREPMLEGMGGCFEIQYVIPNLTDVKTFAVEKAHYIQPHTGGKNVLAAFLNKQFRGLIMKNLFTSVSTAEVGKIEVILNALKTAAI